MILGAASRELRPGMPFLLDIPSLVPFDLSSAKFGAKEKKCFFGNKKKN
jgi:hypothetical protein